MRRLFRCSELLRDFYFHSRLLTLQLVVGFTVLYVLSWTQLPLSSFHLSAVRFGSRFKQTCLYMCQWGGKCRWLRKSSLMQFGRIKPLLSVVVELLLCGLTLNLTFLTCILHFPALDMNGLSPDLWLKDHLWRQNKPLKTRLCESKLHIQLFFLMQKVPSWPHLQMVQTWVVPF